MTEMRAFRRRTGTTPPPTNIGANQSPVVFNPPATISDLVDLCSEFGLYGDDTQRPSRFEFTYDNSTTLTHVKFNGEAAATFNAGFEILWKMMSISATYLPTLITSLLVLQKLGRTVHECRQVTDNLWTKEPWVLADEEDAGDERRKVVDVYDAAGNSLGTFMPGGYIDRYADVSKCRANAIRSVTCVNACEGIPNTMLMAGLLPAIRGLMEEIATHPEMSKLLTKEQSAQIATYLEVLPSAVAIAPELPPLGPAEIARINTDGLRALTNEELDPGVNLTELPEGQVLAVTGGFTINAQPDEGNFGAAVPVANTLAEGVRQALQLHEAIAARALDDLPEMPIRAVQVPRPMEELRIEFIAGATAQINDDAAQMR